MAQGGTVTVVTGGAGEIGRQLAIALHRKGHRLCLTDLDQDALEEAADRCGLRGDPRVTLRTLDVRDPDEWRSALDEVVDRHGRLDVLFNLAGYLREQNLLEIDDREVDLHFAVNAHGVTHGTRVAASHMVRQGHGHIVNVASLMAIAPEPGFSLYSASKHAARGLSLCAAQELLPHGVHVTVVCPDTIRTPMMESHRREAGASLPFVGARPLAVESVVAALAGKVLQDRPIELTLSAPRSARAAVSKLAAAAPGLTVPVAPLLATISERTQQVRERRRRRRELRRSQR